MLVPVLVLLAINLALLARLGVYRRDQPWNSGLNWTGAQQPRFTNPLRGGRLEVLLLDTYTPRGQRLVPWLWIGLLGLAALGWRLLFA